MTEASSTRALAVARLAGDSLVARHTAMPSGGWAWRSAIQAPHYQTDRDVGAASVGEGLLAAYAVTGDARHLHAATEAGDYLLGVAEHVGDGVRWPDWADPSGDRSTTHYTSFDDGAAGISDYLWRLSEVTREPRFRQGALAGMRWLASQATGYPERCRWQWTDDPARSDAHHGVGMGQAGIVWALDAFADRTGDATFRRYARAGAAELRRLDADVAETGFLSGTAGLAGMFLERYAHDGDSRDLATARRLLARDDLPEEPGFELGVAGVAWVDLQAYRILGDGQYRESALRAGAWLRAAAIDGHAWAEQPGVEGSPVHVGLDSGTAGIGWVLHDLAQAGIEPALNHAAASAALDGLRAAARRDSLGAYWFENRTAGRNRLRAEPSWHWGAAGIAGFGARLAGWSGRGPGGQSIP